MNDEFEDHDGCNFHATMHHKTNSKNGPKQSNCSHHHHHHHHGGGNNERTFPHQHVGSLRCMRHDSTTLLFSFKVVCFLCAMVASSSNKPPCATFRPW